MSDGIIKDSCQRFMPKIHAKGARCNRRVPLQTQGSDPEVVAGLEMKVSFASFLTHAPVLSPYVTLHEISSIMVMTRARFFSTVDKRNFC